MRGMHGWMPALILAVALGVTACDGDDGGGGGPIDEPDLVDVKPGAWLITATMAPKGGSGCPPANFFQTLCSSFGEQIDPASLAGTFGLDCDVTVTGNRIASTCSGTLGVASCVWNYQGSGSGSFAPTKDSFSLSSDIIVTLKSGPASSCGSGTCTLGVVVSAQWAGETCPEEGMVPAEGSIDIPGMILRYLAGESGEGGAR